MGLEKRIFWYADVVRCALVVALAGLGGCANEKSYAVSLVFEPAELAARIDHIELSLVATCFSEDAIGPAPITPLRFTQLKRGAKLSGFGQIEQGQFGLYARGIGPCVGAAGCIPIEVTPDGDSFFEVPLREIAASRYDSTRVDNGGCSSGTACTEDGELAVCDCREEGYTYNGTTCVPASGQHETHLSDWAWRYETNAWGPAERDVSNSGFLHGDGRPMRLDGMAFTKGIGVSAPSDIRIDVDGRCSRFRAFLGMDDEQTGSKEAYAEVWVDRVRVYESPMITKDSPTEMVDVSLEGASELRLVTRDPNATDSSAAYDSIDWADARVVCDPGWRGDAIHSFVSDWIWVSEANGNGPVEHDKSNGGEAAGDGSSMRLNGTTYSHGIGVHAPSEIELALSEHCWSFHSRIGVDDEIATGASIAFQVWGDDELLFESATMTSASHTGEIDVDVAGRSRLRLVVTDAGDGADGDHGDWADVRLVCRSGWRGQPVETYVSDWVFARADNRYGPIERDMNNGDEPAYDGAPMRIGGQVYARGIGTLAPARLSLSLNQRCARFRANIGVDDSSTSGGSDIDVGFRVVADGQQLLSTSKRLGEPAEPIELNVAGRSTLMLETDQAGDSSGWDFGNWADARLSCEIGTLGLP